MGLFDLIFGKNNQVEIPQVTSILPPAARQEIMAGRLPILKNDDIFLKRGEKIHLIDKAIEIDIKTTKRFEHIGMSSPGLLKGDRFSYGRGQPIEQTELIQHRGILFITNTRIIFQAKEGGFDKSYKYLTAIKPYADAIELQFGNKTMSLVVNDGSVVYQALQLIKERRQLP